MAGFTVIETVIVLVVLAVLGAMAIPKAYNPGALTLKAQARNFASELHHAQLLAITVGVPVTATSNGNRYTVQYTLNGTSFTPVDVIMANDAVFTSTGQQTLTFDSLGQPQGTLVFALSSSGNASANVSVTATTGLISVQ
jgi:MSHA pilin protein MshC